MKTSFFTVRQNKSFENQLDCVYVISPCYRAWLGIEIKIYLMQNIGLRRNNIEKKVRISKND